MNRTSLSVVALAVGAVLTIGLYNIYSPQVKGMAHDVFDKVPVQRMLGDSPANDDSHKSPQQNNDNNSSSDDNNNQPAPQPKSNDINQDWNNPQLPDQLQGAWVRGDFPDGSSRRVLTDWKWSNTNDDNDDTAPMPSGFKGRWMATGNKGVHKGYLSGKHITDFDGRMNDNNYFIYEKSDGSLYKGSVNPMAKWDEQWHMTPLTLRNW